VVRVRVDRKATSVSPLVVLGIRRDGQKEVLLAVKNRHGCAVLASGGSLRDGRGER
jgi:hypothetical protein